MKKVTKKWTKFGKQDIRDAKALLNEESYRSAAWHCHQAIEKIMKAAIIERGKRVRKIHDLPELIKDTEIDLPKKLRDFLDELDVYYLPPRYPDVYEQIKEKFTHKNIKRVLEQTRSLFSWLENYLLQK